MNDNVTRVPARSLKEQFSKGSEAWKEQSDPIFRFWAEGDWWGFPFFSLSAGRYFGDKETLCLYWPLGTVVITGPKVLDFYGGFCAHRATCLKADELVAWTLVQFDQVLSIPNPTSCLGIDPSPEIVTNL